VPGPLHESLRSLAEAKKSIWPDILRFHSKKPRARMRQGKPRGTPTPEQQHGAQSPTKPYVDRRHDPGFGDYKGHKGAKKKKREYTQKEKYLYKKKQEQPTKWVSAGGVVVPSKDDFSKVLVIKPSNNYGPWSFPKGQIDDGETQIITAAREVKEETGVTAKILKLAGRAYLGSGKGSHSVTHYYLMVRTGGTPHPSDETDKALFVPWDQAINLFVGSGNKRDPRIAMKAMKALGLMK
jgi:8-oxo-dGTP pyrophosphatase MutT (NUDIX family)